MVEGLLSVVVGLASGSRSGCWLGRLVGRNSHSPDPPHSCPCQGMQTLAATLQPCGGCTPQLISLSSWLAPMWWSWMVGVGLDDCRATVAPSKPSRSVGSSRSIGVGEGKSAIRDLVLSCCHWYSWWSLPLIAGNCDEPGLPAWHWLPGGHSLVWAQSH